MRQPTREERDGAGGNENLREVFLAHLSGGLRERPLPTDLDATLGLLWRTALGEWSDLTLAASVFARHLAEHISPDDDVRQALAAVHAADLYLACACAHGVPGAIERFDAHYAPTILAFVSYVDRSPSFADEVRQVLRHKLFLGEGDRPPKIVSYSGRGPLSNWVGITAQRTGVSLARRESGRARGEAGALAEALPLGNDPEMEYLKRRYRAEFREAFQQALAALTPRERMILRLHLVNGLTHEKIAAVYKVSQPTVSRWIASARESIGRDAQRHLRERLHVSTSEFHSLVPLVRSQIDLSLARCLEE